MAITMSSVLSCVSQLDYDNNRAIKPASNLVTLTEKDKRKLDQLLKGQA